LTSHEKRNFPIPIGVIMLPFLLASVFGIIIFGFNIFFVNYNKAYALNNSVSNNSQNRNVSAGSARVNSGLPVETVDPKRNTKPSSVDSYSQENKNAVKTEVQQVNNNVKTAVAGRTQTQRAPVKKESPSANALSQAKKQNWLIQAGAFSLEPSAVKVKNKIVSLGYGVEIIKTGTEKPLYKVVVSAGNSGAAPNDVLKKLNSVGIEGYIIAGRP